LAEENIARFGIGGIFAGGMHPAGALGLLKWGFLPEEGARAG
jgi:hypothetical protein